MSEIPSCSPPTRRASRGVRLPFRACNRMCVSRFSIPSLPGGKNVALDTEAPFERADQALAGITDGQDPRKRLPSPGDEDSFGGKVVKQRKKLVAEFGHIEGLHASIVHLCCTGQRWWGRLLTCAAMPAPLSRSESIGRLPIG